MGNFLKYFFTTIIGLGVIFCVVVLVMSSVHKISFAEEIDSWGKHEQQEEVIDKNGEENTGDENVDEARTETQSLTQSRIQIEDNLILIR